MNAIKEERLYIDLFGISRLSFKGECLKSLSAGSEKQLLAYLLLNSHTPQSRKHIAFLFWPDSTEKQALANLRQRLFHLRKAIPNSGRFILTDDQTLQWNPDAPYVLDVDEFERSISMVRDKELEGDIDNREAALKEAVYLYRGRLLMDCYEEWIASRQDHLHQKYIWGLKELITLLEHKRSYGQAMFYTQKLLSEDQFDEESYRTMMRLQILNGERTKAVLTYRQCEEILKEELAIGPAAETTSLYRRIIKNDDFVNEIQSNYLKYESDKIKKLVGRNSEWEVLLHSWKKSLRGQMHMMLLSGDPGIGKTRLALELLHYVRKQGYLTAYAKSYEAGNFLSFGPIISWFRSNRVRQQVKRLEPIWLSELTRLMPELLEQYPELSHPKPLQESWQRNRFFAAISKALLGKKEPRLFLLDDLQWCDRETLSWLNHLFHSGEDPKLLIVGMVRPVEAASNEQLNLLLENLRREDRLSQILLEQLNREETIELASLEANWEIGVDLGRRFYQETEGNPLFIIETVREGGLVDSGGASDEAEKELEKGRATSECILPKKITEVITARFRKVSKEARELLEVAAVVGREFSIPLLSHIGGRDTGFLIELLEEVQQHQIIREMEADIFDFTHDKLREVAYRRVSKTRRRWLHQKVAEAIRAIHGEKLKESYGLLAFHYKKAGHIEEAIAFYQRAAREEKDMLSKQDVNYYQNALKLLNQLPGSEKRDLKEYNILSELAVSGMHHKEWDSEFITHLDARIQMLARKLKRHSTTRELFTSSVANLLKGELEDFEHSVKEMLYRANQTGDIIGRVEACYLLGGSELYFKGNTAEAIRHFRNGLKLYDPSQHQAYMQLYDLDGGMILQAGITSYMLMSCRIEEAKKFLKKGFRTARSSSQPFNTMYLHYMLAWWQMLLNHPRRAYRRIEKFRIIKTDYELFHWSIHSQIILGWSIAHQSRMNGGLTMMKAGIDELKAYTFVPDLPYYFGMLAELLGRIGAVGEAFSLVNEALDFIANTGVRFSEAEIYRIRGGLYLVENSGNKNKASNSFQRALKVARGQGISIFEHRAKLCLESIEG